MSLIVYHMCSAEAWQAAVAVGRYHGTPDDRRDGFLHFSTAAQIVESAHRHKAGQAGLVLVGVEAARLGTRLRWEPSRGSDLFPHLYGPLFADEVTLVRPLPLDADGRHVFPPLEEGTRPALLR